MNKQELINNISDASEISKNDAKKALDAMLDAISSSLADGDSVALIGFGTFTVKDRAARSGRNPQTGEPMEIAAAKVPSFKPGKALKDACN